MQKIGKGQIEAVKSQLHEYDITLTRILPREIEHGSDTVGEEIYHLLTNRDWLEEDFKRFGGSEALASLWRRMQELDQILFAQRDCIVRAYHASYYRSQRERLKIPPDHWWWYLDDLSAAKAPDWLIAKSATS